MNRAEHLQWCKERALEYVNTGQLQEAFTSMSSDLGKHPDTAGHVQNTVPLGMQLLMAGHLDTSQKMREWITGFN